MSFFLSGLPLSEQHLQVVLTIAAERFWLNLSLPSTVLHTPTIDLTPKFGPVRFFHVIFLFSFSIFIWMLWSNTSWSHPNRQTLIHPFWFQIWGLYSFPCVCVCNLCWLIHWIHWSFGEINAGLSRKGKRNNIKLDSIELPATIEEKHTILQVEPIDLSVYVVFSCITQYLLLYVSSIAGFHSVTDLLGLALHIFCHGFNMCPIEKSKIATILRITDIVM